MKTHALTPADLFVATLPLLDNEFDQDDDDLEHDLGMLDQHEIPADDAEEMLFLK